MKLGLGFGDFPLSELSDRPSLALFEDGGGGGEGGGGRRRVPRICFICTCLVMWWEKAEER